MTAFLLGVSFASVASALTMNELHRYGGVPPGWRFTPPAGVAAAGRRTFVELGCHTCHALQGESFPDVAPEARSAGPDLTSMGSHHPPEYFTEAILNPNAVRIEGPGYLGPDGRSRMPSYPSMTVTQLADLVAYLASLKGAETSGAAHCAAAAGEATTATSFFTQAFEIEGEKLDSFYDWFEQQRYREWPGLLSIQTYAGRRDKLDVVLVLFGFEDEAARARFATELDKQPAATFVRPAERYLFRAPAMYRVEGMSTR